MISYDDYLEEVEKKKNKVRSDLLHLMGTNLETLYDTADKVGVCWMTLKEFLQDTRKVSPQTVFKVNKYLESLKK